MSITGRLFFRHPVKKYASICTRTRRSMCLFFGGWAKGGTQKWPMLIYKFVNNSFYHNNWRCLPTQLLFYHTYINTYGCVRKRTYMYKLHRIRKLDRVRIAILCCTWRGGVEFATCARFQLSMCTLCTLPIEHMHASRWACTHTGKHVHPVEHITLQHAHVQLSMCTLPVAHAHAWECACFQLSTCTMPLEHVHKVTWACARFRLSTRTLFGEHMHT